MLDLEENKRLLLELQNHLEDFQSALQIADLKKELTELEKQTVQEDFWEDAQKSSVIYSKMNVLQKKIKSYENLKSEFENLMELNELLLLEYDADLAKELISNTQKLEKKFDNLEVQTLLSGKYDANNAILTIHPGARAEPNHKTGLKCFIACTQDGQAVMDILLKNWTI